MSHAFSILWANKMHCACKFFKFHTKNKFNLTWPFYNIFLKKKHIFDKNLVVLCQKRTTRMGLLSYLYRIFRT